MPATVSGLVDTIRLRVDNSALTDTQVIDVINNAQRLIQRISPVRINESISQTTIGTVTSSLNYFALPSDFYAPIQLYSVVSGEYHPVTYKDDFYSLITDYAGATGAKEPVWWSEYDGTGCCFPLLTTSVNMTLFYEAKLSDFGSSGTGSNSLLSGYPEVLEYGAVSEYYDTLGETQRAQSWRGKATAALNEMMKAQQSQRNRARNPVPKTPGSVYRGG